VHLSVARQLSNDDFAILSAELNPSPGRKHAWRHHRGLMSQQAASTTTIIKIS
jgi:hypothetical protein